MDRQQIEHATDAITATLASIDGGDLDATDVQRAYLAGAADTLRTLNES